MIGCMGNGLSLNKIDKMVKTLSCLIDEAYLVKLIILGKKDAAFIDRICEMGLFEYVCELPCEDENDILIGAELTDIVLDLEDLVVDKTTGWICALMQTGKCDKRH